MSLTCERVVNIHHDYCGQPAVALVTPPDTVPNRTPLAVCAGHRREHETWGHTTRTLDGADDE